MRLAERLAEILAERLANRPVERSLNIFFFLNVKGSNGGCESNHCKKLQYI